MDKDGSGCFSFKRIVGHRAIAIYFGKNVDIFFPNILFLFELFKEKLNKDVELCFYSFLNGLKV